MRRNLTVNRQADKCYDRRQSKQIPLQVQRGGNDIWTFEPNKRIVVSDFTIYNMCLLF